MKLGQFPRAIATLELQVLEMSKELETLASQVKTIEFEADLQVAQDASLKNDTQRKAAKSQLLQDNKYYIELLQKINIFQGQKIEKEIHLRQKNNEFAVAKLEMQLEIANMNKLSA